MRRIAVVTCGLLALSCADDPATVIEPPTATFHAYPVELPDHYEFDASPSFDADTPPEELRVRWDWQNDGSWDTRWSFDKSIRHRVTHPDGEIVRLQVATSDARVGEVVRHVPTLSQLVSVDRWLYEVWYECGELPAPGSDCSVPVFGTESHQEDDFAHGRVVGEFTDFVSDITLWSVAVDIVVRPMGYELTSSSSHQTTVHRLLVPTSYIASISNGSATLVGETTIFAFDESDEVRESTGTLQPGEYTFHVSTSAFDRARSMRATLTFELLTTLP